MIDSNTSLTLDHYYSRQPWQVFTQGFVVTCRPVCDPLGIRRLLCDVKTSRPIPAIILKMPSAAAADDVAVYAKA